MFGSAIEDLQCVGMCDLAVGATARFVISVTVVAVGSDGPEKQELSVEVLGGGTKVVVDSARQCLSLGETHHAVAAGVIRAEDIYAELGEVVLGTKPGRVGSERIVCDLTGVGAQDAAMAGEVWKVLREA